MKLFVTSLAVLAALCLHIEAKTFTRCGLVNELKKQNFPKNILRDWVCVIEAVSSRRTDAIGPRKTDGSRDHGLFQISDRFFCSSSSRPGKTCHVTCADLRTDDITKAANCAKSIYKDHGFNTWSVWKNSCKGKPLPDISRC
ncbi:hypothetical protein ACJJTC_016026 [Scirpophaga incertulas]